MENQRLVSDISSDVISNMTNYYGKTLIFETVLSRKKPLSDVGTNLTKSCIVEVSNIVTYKMVQNSIRKKHPCSSYWEKLGIRLISMSTGLVVSSLVEAGLGEEFKLLKKLKQFAKLLVFESLFYAVEEKQETIGKLKNQFGHLVPNLDNLILTMRGQ